MDYYRKDYKTLLEGFYQKFNPSKLSSIDEILESFKNNKIELLLSLKVKYNLTKYDPFDNFVEKNKILNVAQQETKTEYKTKGGSFSENKRMNEMIDYKYQIKNLKDSLYEAEKNRETLCIIHNNHIREVYKEMNENLQHFKELILFEKEDISSHVRELLYSTEHNETLMKNIHLIELNKYQNDILNLQYEIKQNNNEIKILKLKLEESLNIIELNSKKNIMYFDDENSV